MDAPHELTLSQARAIAALRARMRDGELVVHARSAGTIVELRRARRTIALARLERDGAVRADRPLRQRA